MANNLNYKKAEIYIDGTLISSFDIVANSMNSELVMLGSNLRADSKNALGAPISFHDPGYSSVSSCESKITYINGEGAKGELKYRGYAVEDLVANNSYYDVTYLLCFAKLPNKQESNDFVKNIAQNSSVDSKVYKYLDGYARESHPMAKVLGGIAALSGVNCDNSHDDASRKIAIYRLIGQLPQIAAASYRHSQGLEPIEPDFTIDYASNFLHMMFDQSHVESFDVFSQALESIFLLHADHEQNASTSTVRMAGSTGTNPYAAIAAGISSLWGPYHGGANEACLNMLEQIGSVDNIDKYIAKAKDHDDEFRLMGFGHRVYRTYDPRAVVLRGLCHKVLEISHTNDPIFELAVKLEKIALNDEYFIEKKLYPNVDFYSGITLRAMGIPVEMFTVIFVLGRISGWLAQWHEMYQSHPLKICRPRQLYSGM